MDPLTTKQSPEKNNHCCSYSANKAKALANNLISSQKKALFLLQKKRSWWKSFGSKLSNPLYRCNFGGKKALDTCINLKYECKPGAPGMGSIVASLSLFCSPDLNTSLVLWRKVIGSWWFTAVYTGTATSKISGSRE